jgi:hypothetical protein
MFWPTMQKLLNIEQIFFTTFLFKSKLKIIGECGHSFGIVGKPFAIMI